MTLELYRCSAEDAPALTRLAHEAKAHWGYADDLLLLWDADLTVTPAFVDDHDVWSVVADGEIVGFGVAIGEGASRDLEHLWVEPRWIGRGVGGRLFEHLVSAARVAGVEELRIVSDPNAVGFYLKMGARVVGERESVPAGRRLPVLSVALRKSVAPS